MKNLTFAVAGIALAVCVSSVALAQGRGGGGVSGGGSRGGGAGGGGSSMGGGGWHGGGNSGGNSGGWHGGGNGGGGWHGGGSGGGYRGGYYGGGYRGGYYYGGWRGYGYGGWYGPSVGVYFGGPGYWGGWPYAYNAAYPSYYPYAVATEQVDAGNYSQGEPYYGQTAPGAVPQNQYWYYCTEPAGYYPYIQNCTKAWMQVVPQFDPGAPRVAPTQ